MNKNDDLVKTTFQKSTKTSNYNIYQSFPLKCYLYYFFAVSAFIWIPRDMYKFGGY